MATINGKTDFVQQGVLQSTWTMTTGTDTGTSEELSRYPFHSIQIKSVPDATFNGATITIQGSDDNFASAGSTFTLKDVTGASMSAAAVAARFDVNTLPQFIRPVTTAGGAATIVVTITSRGYGR